MFNKGDRALRDKIEALESERKALRGDLARARSALSKAERESADIQVKHTRLEQRLKKQSEELASAQAMVRALTRRLAPSPEEKRRLSEELLAEQYERAESSREAAAGSDPWRPPE